MNSPRDKPVPAVFLDREGTIIEDGGDLSHPSQVVFSKDTVSSLRRITAHFALFIVTNQSGVGKGRLSMRQVEQVNGYVGSYLAARGIPLAATYICPHERVTACRCIKPNPYFLKKAERDFGIDLRRSFVVGDHPHDVDLARNAGANGIYVLSGHGRKHRDEISSDTQVAGGIREAAEIVLEWARRTGDSENHQ